MQTVGILLFDDVEVLDFAGPYEVFAGARDAEGQPYFRPVTLAEKPEVRCVGGLRVLVDATLDACPHLEMLIVPGGPGAREMTEQDRAVNFVREQASRVSLVASVCTGSFILARAGLLDGRSATTHSARLAAFQAAFPRVNAVAGKIVEDGNVTTAAGVSSGIDLALYLLGRRFGPEARAREAKMLEGPWR